LSLSYRARPMRFADVPECAKLVAEHPVIGLRYKNAAADLRAAWLRVLKSDGHASVLLEQTGGPSPTICFVGVSVIVSDEFMREMKTPPLRWVGPELAKRMVSGNSPLLSAGQIREKTRAPE
jgi:hypothetical protein